MFCRSLWLVLLYDTVSIMHSIKEMIEEYDKYTFEILIFYKILSKIKTTYSAFKSTTTNKN